MLDDSDCKDLLEFTPALENNETRSSDKMSKDQKIPYLAKHFICLIYRMFVVRIFMCIQMMEVHIDY